MIDFNEQQVSGDDYNSDSKPEDKAKKTPASDASSNASSCGSGPSESWDSCGCGHAPSKTLDDSSAEYGYSRVSDPSDSETVFAHDPTPEPASSLTPPEREALWQSLVASQRPAPGSPALPEVVARNPMQWTLVDLTSSGCDKPGCDPETCDAEDCDTTDAYDRPELELPEYAGSGRSAAVTVGAEENEPVFAFRDEPSPAPTAFVPAAAAAPKAEVKSTKAAAAKRAKKPAATKKATKATAKKGAKKTTAKKGAKKTVAKKGAKKATTTKAKKAAGKTSLPLPVDPNFPRVQAA